MIDKGLYKIKVLQCPNCNNHYGRDKWQHINEEKCPYCGANYIPIEDLGGSAEELGEQ